jgi:hypothetical protein
VYEINSGRLFSVLCYVLFCDWIKKLIVIVMEWALTNRGNTLLLGWVGLSLIDEHICECSFDPHIIASNEIAWSSGCADHSNYTHHAVNTGLYGCHLGAVVAAKLNEEQNHATPDLQW